MSSLLKSGIKAVNESTARSAASIMEEIRKVDLHIPKLGDGQLVRLVDYVSASDTPRTLLVVLGTILTLLGFQAFRTWWRLRHIPGPFLASLTNFQRVGWVLTRRAHLKHQEQHERYGDLVRTGPNTVSFSNAELIPSVYVMRTGFPKGLFYRTLEPYTRSGGSLPAVFNSQNEALHKTLKTPIASLFSLSSMTSAEGLVNDVIEVVQDKFDNRFAATGEVFDLGQWLQFFAFDVMGTMTFSKRYGFLDQGKDVGGMLESIKDFMRTVAPFTQIAWLDWALRKNKVGDSIWQFFRRSPSMKILGFVATAISERRQKLAKTDGPVGELDGRKDFLARFLEIQGSNENVPQWAPNAWTFSNVIAGSDSVGTVMRTAMLNLLLNPDTMDKLYRELKDARLTMPIPEHAEIRDLKYLDACVQEAGRMHPPFALHFERIVPDDGIELLGKYLPGGTVIGGNPYVVNRDKHIFGEDAEFWRPERWLEGDATHKKKLEQSILTFGAGRRVCLGKSIGIFEVKKIIAFLVLRYDIRIVEKERFQTENSWFFIQRGLYAKVKKRAESSR